MELEWVLKIQEGCDVREVDHARKSRTVLGIVRAFKDDEIREERKRSFKGPLDASDVASQLSSSETSACLRKSASS